MVLGPIAVRLCYELLMMAVLLLKNVISINRKLKNQNERSADADAHAKAGRRRLYPAGQRHAPAHAGGCGGPHVGAVLPRAQ